MVESLRNRLLLISVAAIICVGLVLNPAYAYAAGGSHDFQAYGIFYGPEQYGSQTDPQINVVEVNATNRYIAALYVCGYTVSTINGLTDAQKAKLSSLSTGGAFYSFAQAFSNENIGGTTLTWSALSTWQHGQVVYGSQNCWMAIYSEDEVELAYAAANKIIKGGSSGGGTVSAGESFTYNGNVYLPLMEWGTGWRPSVDFGYLRVTEASWNSVKSFADSNGYKIYGFLTNGGNTNDSAANQANWVKGIIIACDEDNISFDDADYTVSFGETFSTMACFSINYMKSNFTGRIGNITYNGNKIYYSACNSVLSDYSINEGPWELTLTGGATWVYSPIYYVSELKSPDDGGGDGGGGDWPTTDVPTPPELPNPGDPTIPTEPTPDPPEPPDPYDPNPWIPIPDIDIDITGDDFQDLLDALNEHCIHLQNSISGNVQQLWENQSDLLSGEFTNVNSNISDNFDSLLTYLGDALAWLGNDVIGGYFSDLKSYLHELFEWLGEQLSFNVNVENGQYDDTSVIYWLKQIWSKLGSGFTIRPTDPVTDNEGWWEWLLELMDNFVSFLLGFGLDKLGDVGSALQTLAGKFPFSLPWDLAALFGLLVAPPLTPSIDFPQFTVGLNGIEQVGTYHLTLADYNDAWEQVRWLERVSFCILLIKSSDFFTNILGKVFGK